MFSGGLLFSQTTSIDVVFNFEIYDPDSPPTETYSIAYTIQTPTWESSPVYSSGPYYQGTNGPISHTFTGVPYPNPLPLDYYRIKVYVQRDSDSQVRTGVSDWSDKEELDDPASPNPIKVQQFN